MLKLRLICWLFLFFFGSFTPTNATETFFKSGAREAALANSALTLGGTWSAYHNPAALVIANTPTIGISYNNRYRIQELSTRSFAGSLPIQKGAFGIIYSYFGSTDYNEQKVGACYAHQLGEKFSAGILIDYYRSRLPNEYEQASAVTGEIGLCAMPSEQLSIGMHLSNLHNGSFNNYKHEQLPMFLNTGVTYSVKDFLISGNILLSEKSDPVFGIGTELNIIKNLGIRAGISNFNSYNFCFGFGYKLKWIATDVAFSRHPNLGYVSQVSLQFTPGKPNK